MTDEAFAAMMEETSPGYAKRERLRKASAEKRENLGRDNRLLPVDQGASFGLGTTSNIDGHIVQNKNKLYNENTGAQMQQALSDTYDQRLIEDEQGRLFQYGDMVNGEWQKNYVDPNIDSTYLYGGKSKTDPTVDKFGLSELGVKARFTPGSGKRGTYGWPSGREGIDPDSAYMNWNVPQQVGERMEGLIHGNRGNIGSREMFDDGSPKMQARRAGLGSGASEYYNSETMPLLNAKDKNIRKGLKPDMPEGQAPSKEDKILAEIFGPGAATQADEDGRQWSNIKGIAAGGANIIKNVMDLASEGAAAAAEMSGAMSPKYAQKVKDYHNSTLEQWQKKLGVNTRYSQEATQELNTAVEEGRYLDALGSVVGNLDVHLSNSAPEMIALSAKLPGLAVAVNSRTKEQTEAFKKAEGREPTSAETAMMVVTNTAVLGAEQLVLIGPLKSVFKSATQSGRTVGKTSRDKVMSVMRTTLGETAQEALDQTQEQYWSKGGSGQAEGKEAFTEAGRKLAAGEIITPNEAIAAGIAGAGMGGALRTAAETVSAPRDILNAQKSQGERDAGEYLVGDEKELGEAFDEMSHADVKKGKEEAVDAAAKIDEMNSIEEGLKSENSLIKRAAENFIKETNDADVGVEEGSDRHIDNIGLLTRDAVLDTENEGAKNLVGEMQKSLNINVKKATAEQIADAIYALDTDARKAITDMVTTEMSNRTSDQKIDEKGGFNKFKEQLKDTIALQDKVATVKTKEWEIAGKNVKEGAKKAPKTLKEGRVNVKKVAKDTRRGKLGTLVDIVTLNNRAATAAKKELNTYTDEALVEAYKNPDASKSLKKYISQVRDKRKEAKKRSGIDKGSYGPRELKNQLLEGDKASYLAAIKKGLAPTSYGDNRDVVAMRGILDTALNSEFITERQSEIFNKRLDKIGAKAEDPKKKVLDAEAEAESKTSEESGLGEQSRKNIKSPELSRSALEKEKAELVKTISESDQTEDGKEINRINEIPESDRTAEDKKELKRIKDKFESIGNRLIEVRSKLDNYSQHEVDMNDAHSSMDEDWFFSGTKPVNASEAFSQEEKDILGIC